MKSRYQEKHEALCDQGTCLQNFRRLTKPDAFNTQVLELRRTLARLPMLGRAVVRSRSGCARRNWHDGTEDAKSLRYQPAGSGVFTDR